MRHEAARARASDVRDGWTFRSPAPRAPPTSASLDSCSIYCRRSLFSSVIFTPNAGWETQSLQEKGLQVEERGVAEKSCGWGACAGLVMKCVTVGIQRGEGLSPGQLLQPLPGPDESCFSWPQKGLALAPRSLPVCPPPAQMLLESASSGNPCSGELCEVQKPKPSQVKNTRACGF